MSVAYADLPVFVLVAKLIPVNVESSMFAILSGISSFSSLVYGRLLGCAMNTVPNVTTDDDSQIWILIACQVVCSFLPLLFLWLIPSDDEVHKI